MLEFSIEMLAAGQTLQRHAIVAVLHPIKRTDHATAADL